MKLSRIFKIFSKPQIAELQSSLDQKEIPLKFEYFAEGADKWDKLIHSNDYVIGDSELELLKTKNQEIVQRLKKKNINIIDLGCGNGRKAIPLISLLSPEVRYFPFDISKRMLEIAVANISKSFPNIKIRPFIVDFEKDNFLRLAENLKNKYQSDNLIIFLGHTLGNPLNQNRVLTNIRESMSTSDYLLVGIEVINGKNINEILKHYKNNKIYQVQFNCLKMLGVKRRSGKFEVSFDKRKTQVETRFVFNEHVEINIGDKKFNYEKGDKILLMVSDKFTQREIKDLLENNNFEVNSFYLNNKKDYALILSRPV